MTTPTVIASRDRSPRRRRVAGVALASVAVLAVVTLLVPSVRDRIIAPKDTAWVTAQRGSYEGHAWQLDIQENDGQLCMSVDGPGGPADAAHTLAGACGFENNPRDAAFYYASGPGPAADSYVTFGPLPSNAVTIRIATNKVLPTYPIPRTPGLPRGRYWLEICFGLLRQISRHRTGPGATVGRQRQRRRIPALLIVTARGATTLAASLVLVGRTPVIRHRLVDEARRRTRGRLAPDCSLDQGSKREQAR